MSTVEREWRNRQTRTFEGRAGRLVRVQVPSLAPKIADTIWYLLFFISIALYYYGFQKKFLTLFVKSIIISIARWCGEIGRRKGLKIPR